MQLEDYFEFSEPYASLSLALDKAPEMAIRIKGHRIGIEHVLAYYHEGYTPEEIAQEFPGLSLEKIYATITFYLAHQESLDVYLARLRARDRRIYRAWAANPPPVVRRLRAIRHENSLSD
jgi:uncharacterized protein (DUF433 family)